MNSRQKLIHLMKLRTKLNKEIDDAREEYVEDYENRPLIFIIDHAIIRYLERVKGIDVGNLKDNEKTRLIKWATKNDVSLQKLRNEILEHAEMEEIVKNNMSSYYKDGFFYAIENLSLITIFKNDE